METTVYRLGEILDNYDYLRKPLSSMERESFKGEYPYYGAQGIIDYVQEYRCDGEYMLIAEDGENLMSRSQPIALIASGKFWVNNHAHVVRTNSLANMRFICYALNFMDITGYVTGSAQPKLSQGNLNRIKLAIPTVEDQERIVEVLSAYDNLIEANNKRIKVLEQMAENLYKEWFVRFRFPGYKSAKFENGIPKGWTRDRISRFYNTTSGGTPSRANEENYDGGTIPWIKTGELQDCIIVDTEEKITEDAIKKSSAKIFPKDSVLMAMYGVNIGMLAYSAMDATCNQACCVFKDKGKINTKHYLFQYLKSIRDYLLLIGFGAAQQNLSQDLIRRIKIVMPDNETLLRFEQTIDPIYSETILLLKANAQLTRQRDLLLPRLMSGKLEV